ncbi:MAG TPA: class IV adenylate cyclase [Pyrinomonadaceae bacterium]|jgi:adenylate cyclase class 2
MAIEIEKKYRLNAAQCERISSALAEIGAQFQGVDFEENTLYRGGALDEKNAVLRVRKIGGRTILTYKRRIRNEFDVKQQIEHETEIGSAEEIENIIENLGFVRSLVYEKRRRIWNFRQVEIVLDELPFGLFMEIEGSITAIAEAEMFLEAEALTVEHETYPRLTAIHGKRNGEIIEARFLK